MHNYNLLNKFIITRCSWIPVAYSLTLYAPTQGVQPIGGASPAAFFLITNESHAGKIEERMICLPSFGGEGDNLNIYPQFNLN